MTKRVAVLMGGWSAEREVSLVSGAAVVEALKRGGYHVTPLDAGRDLAAKLTEIRPYTDVVFNALHGRYGEDGSVQGLCELLSVPYTHSGVLASALAMDKPFAKRLFAEVGIPVPDGRVVTRHDLLSGDPIDRPYVIKPINEGSSVGIIIVEKDRNLPFDNEAWHYDERVLVEEYIAGRELTAAVMGDRVLGVTEIRPREGFYDYDAKYTEGRADHLVPAPLDPALYREVERITLLAHRTLGCRGITRADMRLDDSENGRGLRLLEINTQPGLTPMSLVPEMAVHAGIDFDALVAWIVEAATCES